MCGIVGYVGPRAASGLLIDGLKRLEYRGYDSAGIAMNNGNGLETRKAKGKITMLENAVNAKPVHGTVGIAHTRWATHGAPNFINSHPQMSCSENIAVVHNGIIENFAALRAELEAVEQSLERVHREAPRPNSPKLFSTTGFLLAALPRARCRTADTSPAGSAAG